MTGAVGQITRESDSYLSELIESVAEEWRPEFQHFVETGEAEEDFLRYLNENESAQKAVESAFDLQVAAFEGLALELKNSSAPSEVQERQPSQVQERQTIKPSSISTMLATLVETAMHTPSARRGKMVETCTAHLAASVPAGERDVLKEVVRSLDTNLTKVVGV